MKTVDISSAEFQREFVKTEKFAHKTVKHFGWKFNPDEKVVERVLKGLTNNKILYNKRFCPCFVVKEVDGKYQSEEGRICPCPQAINDEIPNGGICHCGLFCRSDFQNDIKKEHRHIQIDGLSIGEVEGILSKEQISGEELEILIKARSKGLIEFTLIDIREPFEYKMMRIKGTDLLLPISRVQYDLQQWMHYRDKRIIIYCHVGSRSRYLQRALKEQLGFLKVTNLTYGIADYFGEIEKG